MGPQGRAPLPPAAHYLDPRVGEWCFDASPLINAHGADPFLLKLMAGFKGRAHLMADVIDEVKGPAGLTIGMTSWCQTHDLELAEDRALYKEIRERFELIPGRDRGEAASIVAARRHGWRLVLDERIGFRAALDYGVLVTRTKNLLVATVRAGWWDAGEAWDAYMSLVALAESRGEALRLGPALWSGRASFVALCARNEFDSA